MESAWVLRLKDESKEEGMTGEFYFVDEEVETSNYDSLTDDLQEADVFSDKNTTIRYMKEHERYMKERYGENAICNFGYTNMMKHFEFVEVELEEG